MNGFVELQGTLKTLKKLLAGEELKCSRVKYLVTKYVMKCACDPSKTDDNTDRKFTPHNNNGIEITCTGN